ncbi:MAG: DUF1801 domain-containing protein [Chitinophagaceae bacterium]
MKIQKNINFKSPLEFWEYLPEDERIIADVLRQIILETMPGYCKEKLSYNVPFFYGKRRICMIWPASIPWGGIKSGVLFGLCQGNKLKDVNNFLTHGTNKQVFYKIYHLPQEIDYDAIVSILQEAVEVDKLFK